jgi:hypothetical protein
MSSYTQAAPRVLMVSEFTYRGQREEFSNRFSFKGPAPSGDTAWKALTDKIITALQPCFDADVTFVRAYGYGANQIGAIFVHDYKTPGPPSAGTAIWTGAALAAGDAAITGRLTSDKISKRGKHVYSRSYWHGAHAMNATNGDQVLPAQQAALTTFLTGYTQATIDPIFDSCLPDLTNTHSPHVDQWMTTRTLKKRGKRKINAP